jgi:transposase-like protein
VGVEEYPKTLLEFEEQFRAESACEEYLFRLRWPEGFKCPRCQHNEAWHTKRGLWHCSKCGHQTSVLSGTIFQDTSKPLRIWFRAIWHVVGQKNGVNALGLQKELGLGSYRTAWSWLHKLRCAMVRPGRERLSGTVEVDDGYIGAPAGGKRTPRLDKKAVVLVAAEKDGKKIGRIRICQIPRARIEIINKIIPEIIEPGATIVTDGWSGYREISRLGYKHEVHTYKEEGKANFLPGVNLVMSLLKRWLMGTHQGAVRRSHLDYYLDEFVFRFNRRTSQSRGKLFYRMIQQAAQVEPVTIRNISKRYKESTE